MIFFLKTNNPWIATQEKMTNSQKSLGYIVISDVQYSYLENPMDGEAWWTSCSPRGR